MAKAETGFVGSVTARSNVQKVQTVKREAVVGPIVIPCCALLTATRIQCDIDVFVAVNECGLVYDGGVVVDKVCINI